MSKIGFVTYEQDDNIGVSMLSELLQPPLQVLKGSPLGNVVHQQGTDSIAVVCVCDCSIPFLSSSVPNLCLNHLATVGGNALRGKLNSNCGLGLKVELVACESRQQVRLTHTGVAD
eukprot:CAMPEP_0178422618 /NCGR_PEP_ID=MMETSP0689_2-20121128/27267_1 /TAXON_ID=160604 /ORGANISM="Amphidinium massartii, Strain CS-259" /LENGTH=115 /DNA_ID=CAMNT_0020044189 /DNA_START=192 /DNA_END=539 /DNA_ORIENTATION=+